MGKIYFSIEEAETVLPAIELRVKKLIELNEQINLIKTAKINSAQDGIETVLASIELNKQYHKLSLEFFNELEELAKSGGILKDVEKGLVDFYSKLDDRDIFLCWKYGEPTIKYWHESQQSNPPRQPIEILKQEYEKKLEQYR